MGNADKNSEVITDVQTPDSYNAEFSKSITWQEAIERGYIDGGDKQ